MLVKIAYYEQASLIKETPVMEVAKSSTFKVGIRDACLIDRNPVQTQHATMAKPLENHLNDFLQSEIC